MPPIAEAKALRRWTRLSDSPWPPAVPRGTGSSAGRGKIQQTLEYGRSMNTTANTNEKGCINHADPTPERVCRRHIPARRAREVQAKGGQRRSGYSIPRPLDAQHLQQRRLKTEGARWHQRLGEYGNLQF